MDRMSDLSFIFVGGKLTKPELQRRHNAFPAVRFAAWNRFIRAAYNRQAAKVKAKVIKGCQDSGSAVDFMAILTLFHLRFQVLLLFLPPSSRA